MKSLYILLFVFSLLLLSLHSTFAEPSEKIQQLVARIQNHQTTDNELPVVPEIVEDQSPTNVANTIMQQQNENESQKEEQEQTPRFKTSTQLTSTVNSKIWPFSDEMTESRKDIF